MAAYVPRGLQYLSNVDLLYVKQRLDEMEMISGFDTNNIYYVFDSRGQMLYHAYEMTTFPDRIFYGTTRAFDIMILDPGRNQTIHLHRDFALDSCCCPCCLNKLMVYSPPGNLIGTVEQNWSMLTPSLSIKNESRGTVFEIEGPIIPHYEDQYEIFALTRSNIIGVISHKWAGMAQEIMSNADNFSVTFPKDLEVRMKAVILGACILIDYMYYEISPRPYRNYPPGVY